MANNSGVAFVQYICVKNNLVESKMALHCICTVDVQKNDRPTKWYDYVRCLMYNTFPLDPRRPLHMLYMYIAAFNCQKGILGLGGKASKN